MIHIALDVLVDYIRGLGPAQERAEVRAHLDGCEPCRRSAENLTRLASAIDQQRDFDPPPEVVDAAIALFETLPAPYGATDVGRLVFDSGAAERSESASTSARLLLFETSGGVDLQLLVTQDDLGVSVAGQLSTSTTGDPLSSAVSAHRLSGLRPIASARSNASGAFRLDYAPPADALLRFVVAGVLAPIHVLVHPEASA